MPVDYYPQKSVEELTQLLDNLQARQTKGVLTELTAAGVRTVRQIESGAASVEEQTVRVLYSLHLRAAGTDEASKWPNPYASRIRRTRAYYR